MGGNGMRMLRKFVFWIHLGVGLLAGLVLLFMTVSGCLMSYERQLIALADGFHITPQEKTKDIQALIGQRTPSAVIWNRDPSQPLALQLSRTKTEFINPYTAESLGEGNAFVRELFKTLLSLHRSLGQEGSLKTAGKSLVAAASLALLLLLISGLILWCPRRWTRSSFRTMILFRRNLKGRARDWNGHTALGFWSAFPLLIIVTSGIVMAYPWANALLYSLAGESVPNTKRLSEPKSPSSPNLIGVDAALTKVKEENPEWQSIQVNLSPGTNATFVVADSHRGRPDLRKTIHINLATNTLLKTERFEDQSPARQVRTWLRWIHTGEAGGIWGQALAGLASAACLALIVTGYSLSWRRFTKKRVI